MYNWTIPNTPHSNCAMRIRYNISSNDFDPSMDADGNGGKEYTKTCLKSKSINIKLVFLLLAFDRFLTVNNSLFV